MKIAIKGQVMKIAIKVMLGLLVLASSQVSAATFDFISYADSPSGTSSHSEKGYSNSAPFSVTEDGIKLTTYAYNTKSIASTSNGNNDAFAYLDHGKAGLGVCKVLSGDQCATPSDDNVTFGETIVLSFDQSVSLDEVSFKNGNHNETFTGKFELKTYSGGLWSAWAEYSLGASFVSSLIGEKFAFYNPNDSLSNEEQFYISAMNVSAVPVPAALLMFAPALLGFMGLRSKKKA